MDSSVTELIGELDWPGQNKNLLCDFLLNHVHHDDFALEDTDRGETMLIKLEIDMNDDLFI